MYRVILTQRALKDMGGLGEEIQRRVATRLKEYANEPWA